MKENINLEGTCNILQTLHIILQCTGLKLFVILAYNEKSNKTLLYLLSLIYNENFETIYKIFEYLMETYNFNQKLSTVDFGKAGYKALLNVFPHC